MYLCAQFQYKVNKKQQHFSNFRCSWTTQLSIFTGGLALALPQAFPCLASTMAAAPLPPALAHLTPDQVAALVAQMAKKTQQGPNNNLWYQEDEQLDLICSVREVKPIGPKGWKQTEYIYNQKQRGKLGWTPDRERTHTSIKQKFMRLVNQQKPTVRERCQLWWQLPRK